MVVHYSAVSGVFAFARLGEIFLQIRKTVTVGHYSAVSGAFAFARLGEIFLQIRKTVKFY